MKSFLKIVFGSMVGFIIAGVLLLFIFFITIAAIVSSVKDTESVAIKDNTVLEIKLVGEIGERTTYQTNGIGFTGFDVDKNIGLDDYIKNIRKAAVDEHVKGILLNAGMFNTGMASIEALRNELIKFKSSKKFIYAYGEIYTQKAYYLCSVADKIFVNPNGQVEFKGLGTNLFFLKGTLEQLGIEPQIFYCGKYKSATEPLRLNQMSAENKLQTTEYLNGIYEVILNNISKSRNIEVAELHNIANNLLVRSASDAVKYRLADQTAYYDEVLKSLQMASKNTSTSIPFIELNKYDNVFVSAYKPNSGTSKIAVLTASGDIVDGKGDKENIGGEKFASIIQKIRNDKNIKGLVLRVNSPGGSALASDIIWRELLLTKAVKPVSVSMGDYAASGGYYISCVADSIFAESNTITGSIGVFGIIPCMEKFLKDKIGLTFDGVKTGKYSDMPALSRKLTEDEKLIIQAGVDTIYNNFKSRVAQGRHRTVAEIDSIAQGRVWLGSKAVELGLVDKIGSLDDAIASVARKAKLKEYKIDKYPKVDNSLDEMIYNVIEEKKNASIKKELGSLYFLYQNINQIRQMQGVQARLPFSLIIE